MVDVLVTLFPVLIFLVPTLLYERICPITDWVRNPTLTESHEVQLVKQFGKRFPRTEDLPCNRVADYQAVWGPTKFGETLANFEEDVSDDELDIVAHDAVDQHYGALEA
jgi:hypothetical protein